MNMHKYNLSEGWIGEITLADQAFHDAKRRKTTQNNKRRIENVAFDYVESLRRDLRHHVG